MCNPVPKSRHGTPAARSRVLPTQALRTQPLPPCSGLPPTLVGHAHDLHHAVQQPVHHLKARVLGAIHRHKVALILGACFPLVAQQHHVRDLQQAGPGAGRCQQRGVLHAAVLTYGSVQHWYTLRQQLQTRATGLCRPS